MTGWSFETCTLTACAVINILEQTLHQFSKEIKDNKQFFLYHANWVLFLNVHAIANPILIIIANYLLKNEELTIRSCETINVTR